MARLVLRLIGRSGRWLVSGWLVGGWLISRRLVSRRWLLTLPGLRHWRLPGLARVLPRRLAGLGCGPWRRGWRCGWRCAGVPGGRLPAEPAGFAAVLIGTALIGPAEVLAQLGVIE